MANIKEIKSHIKSISDTQKITSAMYLVSSSKLKSAKAVLEKLVPYSDIIEEEYGIISAAAKGISHPLVTPVGGKKAFLIIGSDKGLAGEFIKNIVKFTLMTREKEPGALFYVIGGKIKSKLSAMRFDYCDDFDFTISSPKPETAIGLVKYFSGEFTKGNISSLSVIYTGQVNSLVSEVRCKQLLPFVIDENADVTDTEFFPDIKTIFDTFVPLYLNNTMFRLISESFCCEQNARMLAMDAANNSAKEILDELKVQYNHTRQNAITQEITEISGERKQQ